MNYLFSFAAQPPLDPEFPSPPPSSHDSSAGSGRVVRRLELYE